MTHADVDDAERKRVGIIDGLVRLSVGAEDADDLIEALDNALQNIPGQRTRLCVQAMSENCATRRSNPRTSIR